MTIKWFAFGVFVCLVAVSCWAAPATVTVSDVIYLSDGTPASGTVSISWPAFTTEDGAAIIQGSKKVTIGAGGTFTVALVPNAGATPAGTYYTVRISLSDGTQTIEYWTVPSSGPTTIGAIRTPTTPLPTLPVLSLTRGGTNQNSWIAGRCVRVNDLGTKLEVAAGNCGSITDLSAVMPLPWPAADPQHRFSRDVALVDVYCDTDSGTATLNFDIRAAPNTSGADVLITPITCTTSGSTLPLTTVLTAGQLLNFQTPVTTGAPAMVRIHFSVKNN